jgi:hypothetical protein
MLQLTSISFSKQRIDHVECLPILTKRHALNYGIELPIELYKYKRPWSYKDLC